VLARILDRSGPLPAEQATDGMPLEPGTIRVAVPDRHLLVSDHRIALSHGPTENGHRPAVNSLFRSVALSIGRRAVSVVLSGVLDDGTLGSAAIRARGGTTIAQSPDDALFPAMPLTAIEAGVVDHQVDAGEVGPLLMRLAKRSFEESEMKHDPGLQLENRIAMSRRFSTDFNTEDLGSPSGYTCPDCNGALIGVSQGNYRCHVGHAWTADALLGARDGEIEGALWVAMRSLQEKAKLSRRLADQAGAAILRDRYQSIADETEHAMSVLGTRLSDVYARYEESSG
jgi:two-component system chemotaxis response regulator CheB